MSEIYKSKDMAKLGCNDCRDCNQCCRGMSDSIRLDPYDLYQIYQHLGLTLEDMLGTSVNVTMDRGLIAPYLVMQTTTKACGFNDGDGRCRIHEFRPGLCRLYPLGRHFTENRVEYYMQQDSCPHAKTKIKIEKWIGIPNLKAYEEYLICFHKLQTEVRSLVEEMEDKQQDLKYTKGILMNFLNTFYTKPYETDDFYAEFNQRVKQWRTMSFIKA